MTTKTTSEDLTWAFTTVRTLTNKELFELIERLGNSKGELNKEQHCVWATALATIAEKRFPSLKVTNRLN